MGKPRGEIPVFTGPPAGLNGHSVEAPSTMNGNRTERKRPMPIMDSLREIQLSQGAFIEQGRGGRDHPEGVVVRMFMETDELRQAVEGGNVGDVASELADVILLTTRIAHHFGIPLEVAVSDKIARNAAKYPPAEMERLRTEEGMGGETVERHLKDRWDKDRDNSEFNRLAAVRAELAALTEEGT